MIIIIIVFLRCSRAGSLVGLGHALLHDLPQVGVLHGCCHPLLVIDLLVDCKTAQDRGSGAARDPRGPGGAQEKRLGEEGKGGQGKGKLGHNNTATRNADFGTFVAQEKAVRCSMACPKSEIKGTSAAQVQFVAG